MEEIWKDIPLGKGYIISNLGNIKSYKRYYEGKLLTKHINKYGYEKIGLVELTDKDLEIKGLTRYDLFIALGNMKDDGECGTKFEKYKNIYDRVINLIY